MTGRRIYLVRHGDAVRGVPDERRGLSEAGVRDVQAVAASLARLPIQCHLILASPLRRARETAELIREAIEMPGEVELTDELRPSTDLLTAIKALDRKERGLLAVTHLPLAEDLLSALVCREGLGIARIPPGAAAAIRFDGAPRQGGGLLEWLLVPALVAVGTAPNRNSA